MAESIHVFAVDVEDVDTVSLLMETILCDLEVRGLSVCVCECIVCDGACACACPSLTVMLYAQHGEVSLTAAATHLLITLIETLFDVDGEDTSRLKVIEKLLSEGSPR
jgi:hypothetical protein